MEKTDDNSPEPDEHDEGQPEANYESSAYARPRTKGQFKWNNDPLMDRSVDSE